MAFYQLFHLEFSGALFPAEIFEKVSIDRITRLSARKSTDEAFLGDKNVPISTF